MLKRVAVVVIAGWLALGVAGPTVSQPVPETAPAPTLEPVTTERLHPALRLDRIAEVIAAEAAAQAAEGVPPDRNLLQAVRTEVTPGRIEALTRAALDRALATSQSPAIAPAIRFLETPLGQRYVTLQLSARRAMVDASGRAAALAGFEAAAAGGDARIGQIRRLIAAGDMVEPTVASSMGASLAFMRGLVESGAATLSEKEVLALVWAEAPALQAENQGWIKALLFLALGPLSDAEVERLIREAQTPASRRLDALVQTAFDAAMTQIMRDTGRAVGVVSRLQSL
ncbi:DUF2059 domain-containing protein [uncultured Paracoccus sp.]|uniref:DUF2059 domain-containing protein n=1 Tax=uncultured Paracoccus sp. TaxID=189685 RepID=UPI002603BB99|nr:DUF2059 domain-containing protein [uncultured Paracoccus sp.]